MAKTPPNPDPKSDAISIRKFLRMRETTQMEGDADRSQGRRTRVQQRGRIRS